MTRCSIGGKRVWWHKLDLASEFESDRWNRNAHWNNVVVKEFIYFCVSQVPSQKLWLGMCYVPSGSNSWKPEGIRTKGFLVYMGFVPECIREGEPRNPPYMDSTSVASPLIAEVIGGWGESFSLCLLSCSNPHCCCHMRYNMHVTFDPWEQCLNGLWDDPSQVCVK